MGIIGCGIMFTGLLLGALSGSIAIMAVVMGIGAIIVGCIMAQEHTRKKQAQAWRRQYPTYRY